MTTAAAVILYFLGVYLHHVYVITVLELTGRKPDPTKVVFGSVVWPLMAVRYFYNLVLKGDDEDEY